MFKSSWISFDMGLLVADYQPSEGGSIEKVVCKHWSYTLRFASITVSPPSLPPSLSLSLSLSLHRHEITACYRDTVSEETADQSSHTAGQDDTKNRRHSVAWWPWGHVLNSYSIDSMCTMYNIRDCHSLEFSIIIQIMKKIFNPHPPSTFWALGWNIGR